MIRRAAMCDVGRINAWVERDSGQESDFSEFVSDPANVVLIEGEGGALFASRGPGIYETHCFFEQRGREVIEIAKAMLAMMREHGARVFIAPIPVTSRKVILFVRLLGWRSHGTAQFPHGLCEIFIGE
jgi:hypothetical protein